ncbi:hypothetical protein CDD83_4579 [Cordyceps sp. RAO-2017]|nr:hypothetical protein CDD83_4579 [Cordyceps sp. RAO-2017]
MTPAPPLASRISLASAPAYSPPLSRPPDAFATPGPFLSLPRSSSIFFFFFFLLFPRPVALAGPNCNLHSTPGSARYHEIDHAKHPPPWTAGHLTTCIRPSSAPPRSPPSCDRCVGRFDRRPRPGTPPPPPPRRRTACAAHDCDGASCCTNLPVIAGPSPAPPPARAAPRLAIGKVCRQTMVEQALAWPSAPSLPVNNRRASVSAQPPLLALSHLSLSRARALTSHLEPQNLAPGLP